MKQSTENEGVRVAVERGGFRVDDPKPKPPAESDDDTEETEVEE